MKNLFLILFLITVSFSLSARQFFEEGYFINENGKRIDCFIKNEHWILNPTSFSYQLKQDEDIKTLSLDNVQEFSINSKYKFVKATVQIEQTSDNLNLLTKNSALDLKEETVFLNVLIEGDANLYLYKTRDFTRYFYDIDNGKIEFLIWKQYLDENNKYSVDRAFRKQIWESLKCQDITIDNISALKYKKEDLLKFFIKYNSCKSSLGTNYNKLRRGQANNFHLTLKAGAIFSTLELNHYQRDVIARRKQFFKPNYVIEGELFLPVKNRQLSISSSLSILHFSTQNENKISFLDNLLEDSTYYIDREFRFHYLSLEIPLNLRYYYTIQPNHKAFVTTSMLFEFSRLSAVEAPLFFGSLGNNIGLGASVGYIFKDRISAEYKFNFPQRYGYISGDGNLQYLSHGFYLGFNFLK